MPTLMLFYLCKLNVLAEDQIISSNFIITIINSSTRILDCYALHEA